MLSRNDFSLTHTGNVRSNNEDALYREPTLGLWIVADGMGGHEAGEVASEITVQTISDAIKHGATQIEAIQKAHRAILDGCEKGLGAQGMGSTVVSLHTDDSHYQIAWVGDSRAYLWTPTSARKGTLKQLTTDHSYVQMLVQAGAITAEEANHHPDKNVITQCLGSLDLADVKVDTIDGEWQEGQWIILCSDGLTDELEDEQISAILSNSSDIDSATNALLREALSSGGRDNTTVAVIGKPSVVSLNMWQKLKHLLHIQ